MTGYEAETYSSFNEEEDTANIYTASARVHKLLKARGFEPYKIVNDMNGNPVSWDYTIPKTAVIIKPANKIIKLGGRRKGKANAPSSAAGEQLQ